MALFSFAGRTRPLAYAAWSLGVFSSQHVIALLGEPELMRDVSKIRIVGDECKQAWWIVLGDAHNIPPVFLHGYFAARGVLLAHSDRIVRQRLDL